MTATECAVADAVAELQLALVGRARAQQEFVLAMGAHGGLAIDRQSLGTIPSYVRLSAERVSKARLALDLVLLESA